MDRLNRHRLARVLAPAVAATLFAIPAYAVDTWTNPAGGSWTTNANWSLNRPPAAGEDAVNPLTGATINFSATASLNSFLSESAFNLQGGTLAGSQSAAASTVQVNDLLTVTGGQLNNLTLLQGTGTAAAVVFAAHGNNAVANTVLNAALTFGDGGYARVFGTNTLNATLNFASTTGNGLQFHDANARVVVSATGAVRGYGQTTNFLGGGTVENDGLVSADVDSQSLILRTSNLTGTGTYEAKSGGRLVIGGRLLGNNTTVNVATGSSVLVDDGSVAGTFAAVTGTGIGFSSNGNNSIEAAQVNGNLSFTGGAFARLYGATTVTAGTVAMAGSGGLQFYDGNAALTLTPTAALRGFGFTTNFFTGGTLTNGGTISADAPGQVLSIGQTNLRGAGVFEATNGGTLVVRSTWVGENATVNAGAPGVDAATVRIDGGSVRGTFAAATGSGISFSPDGNNNLDAAAIAGNVSLTAPAAFARVYNANTVSGTVAMGTTAAGAGIQIYDANASLTLTPTGAMRGHGRVFNFFTGGALANHGTISADSSAVPLVLDPSNLTGSGTFEARDGATLAVGAAWTGSGATVRADTGTVLVNGGSVRGTFASSTGSGISFSSNGNNNFDNASVAGNVTLAGDAFARVYNRTTVSAGTLAMSTPAATGGVQIYDGNTRLTIAAGATLRGYGRLFNFFDGGTVAVDGAASADVPGQVLAVNSTNLAATGNLDARNGGQLHIGGILSAAGATVTVDPSPLSGVFINGGSARGSLASSTGTGLSFTANANNNINTLTSAADLTFPDTGYARVFNANAVTATIHMATATNGLQFHNGDASLTIGATGRLRGFGRTFNFFDGGTLVNHGAVAADVPGQTLNLNHSNTTGTGVFEATSGATLAVATRLVGNGATVHSDTGTVLVNGGTIAGSYAAATGSGINYAANSANATDGATINGNVTVAGAGYTRLFNASTVTGVIALSTTAGLQFHDGNATLTSTGTLRGFGQLTNFFTGGTLITTGLTAADVPATTLAINQTNWTNSGDVSVVPGATLSVAAALTHTAGHIDVDGLLSYGNRTLTVPAGVVSGTGTISATVLNNTGATLAPGDSPGTLTLTGAYTQSAAATFDVDLAGYAQGATYDLLSVAGPATLAGTINVDLENGFLPAVGDQFVVMTRGGAGGSGAFTHLTTSHPGLAYTVDYGPSNSVVRLTITAIPEPASALLLPLAGLLLGRRRRS